MSIFSFNDGELYYEVTGTGDLVVLVHGFSLDRRMWRPQVEALSKKYEVINYDLRGFGRSSVPTGAYSHREDLHALINHLGAAPVHVVGQSMGGGVALDYALSYPDEVRSLVLIDSGLGGYAARESDKALPDTTVQSLAEAKRQWYENELFASSAKHPQTAAVLEEILADYSGWHWSHPRSQTAMPTPAWLRLDEIKVPVLILVGDDDVPYFHKVADAIAGSIKHSVLKAVPKAGHMANLDNPGAVNALILEHLSSVES